MNTIKSSNITQNHNSVVRKLIVDINMKLITSPRNDTLKLEKIKNNAMEFLNHNIKIYPFLTNYLDTMYEILKSYDTIKSNYYTNFAKDFIKILIKNDAQLLLTFDDLTIDYFIDIRPQCTYPVQLINLLENNKGYVESKLLSFKELSYHDLGHAYVMNRQDQWLFETSNISRNELINEWVQNKNKYVEEYNKLQDNDPLKKAIKNLENIKTKIIRGDYDTLNIKDVLNYIDDARIWLLDLTNKFLVNDNIKKMDQFKNIGYTIKKYPDVESYEGLGYGRLLISEIIKNYALYYPKNKINHSQPLICGKGLFQIADPSWRKYMLNTGFKTRFGAETFYLDKEYNKLEMFKWNDELISHNDYNKLYGIPQIYENNVIKNNTKYDLSERISEVIKLSNSNDAKLQYFQMILMFDEFEEY